ncbi:hypothetical protein ACI0FM_13215 [Paenochrobactrum sp. BZR 588]|uniref:hypothetical protein n=1 Tax=Paenochrobactrum TaxID=999488 RepID=UPI0035BC63EC
MKAKITASVSAALVFIPLMSCISFADQQRDQVYNTSRNQLGLIKYCTENEHLPAEAVTAFQKMVAVLPVASDKSLSDKYEAEGAQGNGYDGAQIVSIKDIATAMGSDNDTYCSQYKSLINQ